MSNLIFQTAAGHRIVVNPKRQRRLFLSLQTGLIAESRIDQRQINYQRFRQSKGRDGFCRPIKLAYSLKTELARLDPATFVKLDRHILALADRPTRAGSQPKHFRWFQGDLRLYESASSLIVYTIAKDQGETPVILAIWIVWREMERVR